MKSRGSALEPPPVPVPRTLLPPSLPSSRLDPLKVSGLLVLLVGPNSRRAGGGSLARIVEAAGRQGWGLPVSRRAATGAAGESPETPGRRLLSSPPKLGNQAGAGRRLVLSALGPPACTPI